MDIFSALHQPAPILRTLHLRFDRKETHPVVSSALSSSIFASDAPQLREIFLLNVELPPQFPASFRRLESSMFSSFSTRRFPLEFVAFCPNLHDFVVYGKDMQLTPGSTPHNHDQNRNRLQRVLIVLKTGYHDALDAIGAAHIQDVGVGMGMTDHHGQFLDVLRHDGPLEMFIAIRNAGLLVEYRNVKSGLYRRFVAPRDMKPDAPLVAHYVKNTTLSSRVETFYTSTGLLSALNALHRLPECTLFGIGIDPGHGLYAQDMPVSVPKLRKLEIWGDEGHVDAGAVAAFIERCLTDIPIPLTVAFQSSLTVTGTLDGDRFILADPFSE
ncbi:hypothetical protein EXIGLDRAFT_783607 [Exidia glandulosa HHB12029]|uniref:Uncharacterized protein n=1 Tax=Exidia glandulosa HHB12029 TaxID=1314781 RepID=A0A166MZ26_EXIGL|nr:hypothetical protein EXIGLDRAFT_783607 [Exidia glandulosa HHB12029]